MTNTRLSFPLIVSQREVKHLRENPAEKSIRNCNIHGNTMSPWNILYPRLPARLGLFFSAIRSSLLWLISSWCTFIRMHVCECIYASTSTWIVWRSWMPSQNLVGPSQLVLPACESYGETLKKREEEEGGSRRGTMNRLAANFLHLWPRSSMLRGHPRETLRMIRGSRRGRSRAREKLAKKRASDAIAEVRYTSLVCRTNRPYKSSYAHVTCSVPS